MKKLILILIISVTIIGCKNNNPLLQTQWEGINDAVVDIQLISFDKDTCSVYVTSKFTNDISIIGVEYEINGNIVSFKELPNIVMPRFILDGNFLVNKNSNVPQFKKIK